MIEEKIEQLFELRKIPFMLSNLPENRVDALNKDLISLQKRIYELDHYLETSWDLDASLLENKRKAILDQLNEMGYHKVSSEMISDIVTYEKHESQLREAVLPTSLDPLYYYHFKSCDVRLIRHIILDQSGIENTGHILNNWKIFDLITEVYDDIEDLEEDMGSINGNAFLINLKEYGVKETMVLFSSIFSRISIMNANAKLDIANLKPSLNKLTYDNLRHCQALMLEKLNYWLNEGKHIKPKLYMYFDS